MVPVMRVERVWGAGGRAVCRPGDDVEPASVVGYRPAPPPRAVLLETDQGQTVATLLHQVGDRVARGEPLAFYSFMFGLGYREFVSPVDGEVVAIESGRVMVQPFPPAVKALVRGRVEEVRGDRAVISAEGIPLLGRAAWGPARGGDLVVLPNGEVSPARLGHEHTGRVVAGGWADREAVERAFALGVAALVLGGVAQAAVEWLQRVRAGMSPDEYLARVYEGPRGAAGEPLWQDQDGLPLSLVTMGGFGPVPLSRDDYGALVAAQDKWCYVSGEECTPPWVGIAGARSGTGPDHGKTEMTFATGGQVARGCRADVVPGARVCLTGLRRAGQEGTVVEVLPEPVVLPTEVPVPAARVRLNDGSLVIVPLSNLELLPG